MMLEMQWMKLLVGAAVIAGLVGCKSATGTGTETAQDASGATMELSVQNDKDFSDSVVWLPDPLIATSGEFEQTLRDNQSPIQSITGEDLLYYKLQYSAGFYSFFSKRTTRDVQSESDFRKTFGKLLDEFDGSPEKIGFQTSRTGGYIWRSDAYGFRCIAGQIGTGVGGRASVGASSGLPYNVIVALFYCDEDSGAIDKVEDFLRGPKLVQNRDAFAAHVAQIRSRLQ